MKGNRKMQKELFFLFPFIFLMFFASLYEFIGTELFRLKTKYWFRIYTLLEFYTVFYFYYKLLEKRKIFIFIGSAYLLVYLGLMIDWINNPKKVGFNDLPLNISIVFLVLFCTVMWFVDIFKKLEDYPLYKRPVFYIISALLLYFTGTFIVFLITDYVLKKQLFVFLDYWIIIIIFNIVLRLIITVVLWRSKKEKSIHVKIN